jgi:GntR family phosphonate transport system transcriptional regulator
VTGSFESSVILALERNKSQQSELGGRARVAKVPTARTAKVRAPSDRRPIAPREDLLVSAKSFVRQTGEPIWSQISRSIEDQIVAGNLPSGTRLPTETQLAESFQVNRHTLRRSLRELVRKGLISATPRRGTIVSRRRISYPIGNGVSFGDVVASTGREPGDRLVDHSIGRAPKDMAEWLGIAELSNVVELKSIRVANEVPICLATSWLPADRFERIGAIFERLGCLNKAMAMLGVNDYSLKQTRITSQPATPDELKRLEISPGASVLVVSSLYVDQTQEPILVCHNRFAADRVELVVDA